MKFKNQKNIKKPGVDYDNRINVVIAIIFLLVLAVVYRLYYLQVLNHDLYVAIASSQHEVLNELEPERGRIFIQDKGGNKENNTYPIAINKDFALIYAVPKDIEDPQYAAEKVYEIFFQEEIEALVDEKMKEEQRNEIYDVLDMMVNESEAELINKKNELLNKQKSLLTESEYVELLKIKREANINIEKEKKVNNLKERFSKKNDPYEPIKEKVSEEVLLRIKDLNIKGINYLMQKHRFYPEDFISHVTGFVGYANDEKKGMYGLEGFFNRELIGEYGSIKAERDANGSLIIVNNMQHNKEKNGSDLVLTIDRTIQYTVCTKLREAALRHGADSGSVIVMKPQTGEIMALCAYPDYDPNNFSESEDSQVFNNQAIFGQYEPGSVFKAVTMAAGLDSGVVTPQTVYSDAGYLMIEGWSKPIRNSDFATRGGHGTVNMSVVLENSLNTGVIFVMNKVGDKKFAQYVKDFGFGEKTGIELETEAPGDISNLLRKTIKPIDSSVASFGQGITVTPLQMINSYAAIANGGKLMKPFLVKEVINPDGTKIVTQPRELKRVISEKSANLLSGMLVNVIDKGHTKSAAIDGYYVAGKTGTAQVADSLKKGYGEKTIHTFVGFTPVEEPEFVMLVRLDDPKDARFADSSAAPLFSEISKFILNYLKIPKERLR